MFDLPKAKQLIVNDSPESTILLESWMLFPAMNDDNEQLRTAYRRIARLDSLGADLKIEAERVSDVIATKQLLLPEAETQYLELTPRTIFGPHPVLIMPGDFASLLNPPTALCSALALKNSQDALLAGSMLVYMRLMDKRQINNPSSFSKARQAALRQQGPKILRRNHAKEDLRPREYYGMRALNEAWVQFAPVSHLWAAVIALRGLRLKPLTAPLQRISVSDLLCIASLYAKWGRQFFWNARNAKYGKYRPFEFFDVGYEGETKAKTYNFSKLPNDKSAMAYIQSEKK